MKLVGQWLRKLNYITPPYWIVDARKKVVSFGSVGSLHGRALNLIKVARTGGFVISARYLVFLIEPVVINLWTIQTISSNCLNIPSRKLTPTYPV